MHLELLEEKYGTTEWFDSVSQYSLPIELSLWRASFKEYDHASPIELPYELAHLWQYLLEVGPASSISLGVIPISYQEIQAWMSITKVRLSPWEIVLLRRCSQQWVSSQQEAAYPDSTPPWIVSEPDSDMIAVRRKIVADRLKKVLGKKKVKDNDS